jgi:hypothetical protein
MAALTNDRWYGTVIDRDDRMRFGVQSVGRALRLYLHTDCCDVRHKMSSYRVAVTATTILPVSADRRMM